MLQEIFDALNGVAKTRPHILFVVPKGSYKECLRTVACYSEVAISGRTIRTPTGVLVTFLPSTAWEEITAITDGAGFDVILAGWEAASMEDLKTLPKWTTKAGHIESLNAAAHKTS